MCIDLRVESQTPGGVSVSERVYAIHSDEECERLEAQARLAPVSSHLKYLPLKSGLSVLDAGCGSGSMTRQIAAAESGANIVGVDRQEPYLDFARRKAESENLTNVTFAKGDVRALPFPDATFDIVWHKYLLQWVGDPQAAMTEFARVTKPGGLIVSCNFDSYGMIHEPPDPVMQPLAEHLFSQFADLFIGRRMARMSQKAGLVDIQVAMEVDNVHTVVGRIDAQRRRNWEIQFKAAREYTIKHLGSAAMADAFADSFLRYQDREDTASYCTLFFVSGRKPP
jgi:ubiquinone/menaquinone biosynthesis C-methylase UbiE